MRLPSLIETNTPNRKLLVVPQVWKLLRYPGAPSRPQAPPGVPPGCPQAPPGVPRRLQASPGAPRRPQVPPGVPRRPQAYQGIPRRPQTPPGAQMRPKWEPKGSQKGSQNRVFSGSAGKMENVTKTYYILHFSHVDHTKK